MVNVKVYEGGSKYFPVLPKKKQQSGDMNKLSILTLTQVYTGVYWEEP